VASGAMVETSRAKVLSPLAGGSDIRKELHDKRVYLCKRTEVKNVGLSEIYWMMMRKEI
jgi:hypothetical protein